MKFKKCNCYVHQKRAQVKKKKIIDTRPEQERDKGRIKIKKRKKKRNGWRIFLSSEDISAIMPVLMQILMVPGFESQPCHLAVGGLGHVR